MAGIRFEDTLSVGDTVGEHGVVFSGFSHRVGNRRYYNFVCPVCGSIFTTRSNRVTSGSTKTCGKHPTGTHRLSNSKIYRVHRGMLNRCYNEKQASYKNYGGRGISVCEEWHTFETFYSWAMLNGYEDGLSIGRQNNDGNYQPDNCKWETKLEQGANTRANRYCFVDGVRMHISEGGRVLGYGDKKMAYFKRYPKYNPIPDRLQFE